MGKKGKREVRKYVYFAENGGYIKIGLSKDIAARISNLQTGSPLKITLLAYFEATEEDEKMLHRRYKHFRNRGEWFRKNKALMDFIDFVAQFNVDMMHVKLLYEP